MNEYLIKLKSEKYNANMENFLKCHNVKYDFLKELSLFTIESSPQCINCIKTLQYIDSVLKNISFVGDEIDHNGCSQTQSRALLSKSNTICPNPELWRKWIYEKTNILKNHTSGNTGEDMKIAVLDSGVISEAIPFIGDPNCPLKVKSARNFTNGVNHDILGSGTEALGIIGLNDPENNIFGVAYNASLHAFKVIEDNGNVNFLGLIQAINWCMQINIDVIAITVSFRLNQIPNEYKEILQDSVNRAVKVGNYLGHHAVVVGPIGEEGYPTVNAVAAYPNVFSITAIEPIPDKPFDISNLRLINSANTGAGVGFSAPGNSLKTLTLGNKYTNIASGTGIAAAYVSGGIALILPLRRLSVPNNPFIYDNLYKILANDAIKIPQLPFIECGEGLTNFKFIVE